MSSAVFSERDLAEATELLGVVLAAFAEEEDGAPSLGELLEILGSSVPIGSEFMGDAPDLLTFRAKVGGSRWYKPVPTDRVDGLNDNTFNEAAELLAFLVERAGAQTGREASPKDLANYVLQVLRAAAVPLADVSSADVSVLAVVVPKRLKVAVGDVVTIPAKDSGYRLAVVLDNVRGAISIGLLDGVFAEARVGDVDQHRPAHIPINSDDDLIAAGTWPIIAHSKELLALFPEPPVMYLRPLDDNDRNGKFGLAVTGFRPGQNREARLVGRAEAEAIGLLDGLESSTYIQFVNAVYLPTLLAEGHFDRGLVPGSW